MKFSYHPRGGLDTVRPIDSQPDTRNPTPPPRKKTTPPTKAGRVDPFDIAAIIRTTGPHRFARYWHTGRTYRLCNRKIDLDLGMFLASESMRTRR
jgi:hypothetical protein